ncbi:MAG: hypothetical protein OXL38_11850 [Gammaproteobacteria bacterium]|nr:hypothetical protein [Gammaproteobacteria bacterium]
MNPFYDVAKADAHTPKDVATLFVRDASPVWRDLQYPINHLVVGARGTGKTMALRQLDYRTMASGGQISDFVGVYAHVSRISAVFHALFNDHEEDGDAPLTRQFQQVFADYLALEIVSVLCELADGDDQLARPDFSAVLRLPGGFDTGNITADCVRLQIQAEASIQSWQISRRCTWQPLGDLPAIVARLAEALRHANPWLAQERPCLYVLLDESSPVPRACQSVLNSLLLRGQPYCAKLAVRPFEWHTLNTPSGRPKEQDTDVFVLHLDHSDELSAAYVSHMEQIVDKVLGSREVATPGIRKALPGDNDYPYSGFDAVCAASSGNPQDLLMICSAIFAARGNADDSANRSFEPVPPSVQHDVVRMWSRDFGRRNAYDASRRLCRSLAQQVKQVPEASRSIGFEYRSEEADLFADDSLPDDLAEPFRPAFAGGFIRLGKEAHPSLFAVPGSFRLSRGVLPDLEIALDTPTIPPVALDRTFIETKARISPGFGPPKANPALVVYVSGSFLEPNDPDREAMTHALSVAGFAFPKVRLADGPSGWFYGARRKIAKSRVALVGDRGGIPRAMFEIGLCAGANRPVDVIVGRLDNGAAPLDEVAGLPPLPTVSQQADDRNHSRFAAEVRATAEQLIAHPSDFANVALTGVSLRPRRRREKTVYVSVPDMVADRFPLNAIREGLAARGWSMIAEADMTSYAANVLQVPVLCAFTARIGVIDTSAADGFDPIQSYKLGLFAGKRGWRVLHTSHTEPAIPSLIDHVVGAEHYRWENEDELVQCVLRFVRA